MMKAVLTEIVLFCLIAGFSVGLYQIIYGINLGFDNYLDMLTFEARRLTIVLEILGIFFLPTHIATAILRQFYYKFLNPYLAFQIFVATLFLAGLFTYKYLFLSSKTAVMAKEGWTIYPPLTGLSVLDEHDPAQLQMEQNLLLVRIGLVLLLGLGLTLLTIRRRKKKGI